jgi:aminocarboxymuconate-semialdehyde decarboxylase
MAKSTQSKRARSKAKKPSAKRTSTRARRPFVIDIHAHVAIPELLEVTRGHQVNSSIPPGTPEKLLALSKKWAAKNLRKMNDFAERLRDMDKTGVDIQVLTSTILRTCTYWADPETGLKWDRFINERIAETVTKAPARFVGLGSVPLQAPELAAKELERCMNELGLLGVQISSHAYSMELGDQKLRPFWAAAEKLGAVIYIHPAGITDERYAKHQLWNSIGQNIEEAMAMASLFYEGTLDAFPKLKICIAHGGGFLPFYAGRVDRNYVDKAFTRVNMTKSPSDYMRENFWYDTCVYNLDQLEYLVRKVGASRIVLGSDYPVGEDFPVDFVRKARGLSAASKAAILGGNAAKLLGLSI